MRSPASMVSTRPGPREPSSPLLAMATRSTDGTSRTAARRSRITRGASAALVDPVAVASARNMISCALSKPRSRV